MTRTTSSGDPQVEKPTFWRTIGRLVGVCVIVTLVLGVGAWSLARDYLAIPPTQNNRLPDSWTPGCPPLEGAWNVSESFHPVNEPNWASWYKVGNELLLGVRSRVESSKYEQLFRLSGVGVVAQAELQPRSWRGRRAYVQMSGSLWTLDAAAETRTVDLVRMSEETLQESERISLTAATFPGLPASDGWVWPHFVLGKDADTLILGCVFFGSRGTAGASEPSYFLVPYDTAVGSIGKPLEVPEALFQTADTWDPFLSGWLASEKPAGLDPKMWRCDADGTWSSVRVSGHDPTLPSLSRVPPPFKSDTLLIVFSDANGVTLTLQTGRPIKPPKLGTPTSATLLQEPLLRLRRPAARLRETAGRVRGLDPFVDWVWSGLPVYVWVDDQGVRQQGTLDEELRLTWMHTYTQRFFNHISLLRLTDDRTLVFQPIVTTPMLREAPGGIIRLGTISKGDRAVHWEGWIPLPSENSRFALLSSSPEVYLDGENLFIACDWKAAPDGADGETTHAAAWIRLDPPPGLTTDRPGWLQ